MSLYNAMFGESAAADILLDDVLQMTDTPDSYRVGRYRDAWLERVDGAFRIAVYTRNGGSNRECWGSFCEDSDCAGCIMTKLIPTHPRYLHDIDDDFDCTYATVYYRPSEALRKILATVNVDVVDGPVDTSQRWKDMIERIGNAPS